MSKFAAAGCVASNRILTKPEKCLLNPYDILENFILTKHSGENAYDCWNKVADRGTCLMVFIPNPGRYWGLLDRFGLCIF